ncbi:Ig-like domain-containing protein [Fibrella sp. ES10-3-2-2]
MGALTFGHPVTGICNHHPQGFIRLYIAYSLIFFVACLPACRPATDTGLTINWTDKRATSLTIPDQAAAHLPDDSLPHLLTVRLAGQQTAIAGQYERTANGIRFEPLVPFTRGQRYTVWLRNNQLYELTIPALNAADKPVLQAIYPGTDSVPANLLKIYLRFSRSMREGQSVRYVALLDAAGDTLHNVFLDLQPELWNADRTMLTLWLDPGRIKRDLQPNKRLGAPLNSGGQYRVVVSPNWTDALGAPLGTSTTKSLTVIQRDSLSPVVTSWSMRVPKSGTLQQLVVAFGEPLDYYLLTETLQVLRPDGTAVPGTWQIGQNETQSQFTPTLGWTAGRYRLRIENRLEDLAGNNLNRPFDRDITQRQRPDDGHAYKEVAFIVSN